GSHVGTGAGARRAVARPGPHRSGARRPGAGRSGIHAAGRGGSALDRAELLLIELARLLALGLALPRRLRLGRGQREERYSGAGEESCCRSGHLVLTQLGRDAEQRVGWMENTRPSRPLPARAPRERLERPRSRSRVTGERTPRS